MGGVIRVESVLGQGSTFSFVMPLRLATTPIQPPMPMLAPAQQAGTANATASAPAAAAAVAPAQPAKPNLPRMRVLVAEDNPTNQMVVRAMLSRLGQTVEIVSDGAQAVEAVKRSEYDLVLMDVQMPEMDGYEATRAIRALDGPVAKIPIVALTANAVAGFEELSMKAGMDGHVAKPVTLAALAALLGRFASRRKEAAQTA
jgi:CheY-like chemotaxis protein